MIPSLKLPPLAPPMRTPLAESFGFSNRSTKVYFPHLSSKSVYTIKIPTFASVLPRAPTVSSLQFHSTQHDSPSSAATADIDMVRNREGVFTPKQNRVVVLWDLDNKPPRGPPYQAAVALKKVAERFGEVVDISAYANRHAFIHLPNWVIQERRERRRTDILERKGILTPDAPYICSVCGRKCKTNLDLKKHFKQLHERERQKKLSRLKQLKGKKRQKFKERHIANNHKYEEAARTLITPKTGYGLARELRRAGVYVKTVDDKPQAADWALKRQMLHSMTRGVDWLFLVSDDSDFSDMLRKARESNLGTVVVGDWDRALGRHADLWVPWNGVENGELSEEDLMPKSGRRDDMEEEGFVRKDGLFALSEFDESVGGGGSELDKVVDELVERRSGFDDGINISAFSEGEEEDWPRLRFDDEVCNGVQSVISFDYDDNNYEDDFWESEDEE